MADITDQQAQELARILKEKGPAGLGQDRYSRGVTALREYQFGRTYVDRSPAGSSKAEKERRRASLAVPPGIGRFDARKEEEVDPTSRDAILAQEEQAGLDTISGFGNLKTVARAALEFNSPRARVNFMNAAVRDQIEAAGIEIPSGVPVVRQNENLGEIEFLRPTEDGKLRWTLADAEVFRGADVGQIADLPSLLGAVGATATAAATRHPALAELFGDYAGRNIGTMLEYLINQDEVTRDEYMAALRGNVLDSALETALSRAAGRAFQASRNLGSVRAGDKQPADELMRSATESANTLEALRKLTDKEFRVTVGAATNSDTLIQRAASREKKAPAAVHESLELQRGDNLRALDDAQKRIANNVDGASSLNYNPYDTVERAVQRVNIPAEYRILGTQDGDLGRMDVTITPTQKQAISADDVADARFDQGALESELTSLMNRLPEAQARANDANLLLKDVVKWSEQRQTSGYTVTNSDRSGLSQQIRKIQNRAAEALTGTQASEADRKLAAMVRREVDEETGETFLTGLAGSDLDLGQLISARDKFARMAAESGDEDLLRTTQLIDNLLKNAPILTRRGNKIAASTRAKINDSINRARTADAQAKEIGQWLSASNIFKKNADGDFINTSGRTFETILASRAFMKNFKPVMDGNPIIRNEAINRLYEVYRRDVVEKGWSRSKHNTFIKRFEDSIGALFTPEQARALSEFRLPDGAQSIWTSLRQTANNNAQRVLNLEVNAQDKLIRPDDILKSFHGMGPRRSRQWMRELERNDPALARELRATSARQIQNTLSERFFDIDQAFGGPGTLHSAKHFQTWFRKNKDVLEAVHGQQYVTDMQSVVNAHLLDARRTRLRGAAPDAQGDVIRITRSMLGPLSRPQRMITAGNYAKQRALAKVVAKTYSDPQALRQLRLAKGLDPKSRQGIALLSRLGIFEAAGISEGDPDFIPRAQELIDQVRLWERESIEDANVE